MYEIFAYLQKCLSELILYDMQVIYFQDLELYIYVQVIVIKESKTYLLSDH